MNEQVVLVGAGSAMFTRGLLADMIRSGWQGRISLVDVSDDALSVVEGLARKMIEAKGVDIKLQATTDIREALPGATVVVCTIGVGGRRAWERDVYIPREHGIYQPVGDSVMPGGTSRALRMIPAMVDIAEAVMELAPDALFFNYGNPMSAVCRGVRKATGANMIGLCHGVFHVARTLAARLGIETSELEYNAVGINHMTWFTDIRTGGQDLMPRLREIGRERLQTAGAGAALGVRFAEAGTAGRDEAVLDDVQPFSWQLLELFGAYPAPGDRHLTEFFGGMFAGEGAYYGHTLGLDSYSFEGTIKAGDNIFESMRKVALSSDPLPEDYFGGISGEHEQVTDIVTSIRTGRQVVYSANVPNRGQAPNLPDDAVIECPCITACGDLHAIAQAPLDAGIAGTLATRLLWAETIVDAALTGSRDKFVQALILDGAVASVEKAGLLADDLLRAHAEHLPDFSVPANAPTNSPAKETR